MENSKLGTYQIVILMMGLILSTGFFTIPTLVAATAAQDGWISMILATAGGIGALLIYSLLANYFMEEKENVISFSERVLGKFLGKVIGISFALYFLISNTTAIRLGGELVVTNNMPRTPIEVIHIALVLLGAYAAWHGLEVIARMTTFVLPLLVGAILLSVFMTIPGWDAANLQPVMEQGVKPIILASITPFGWIAQCVILLVFYPSLQRDKNLFLKSSLGVFFIGSLLTLIVVSTILVFGPKLAGSLVFSFYQVNAYIDLVEFLERMEIVTASMWLPGVLIKVSIWYYAFMITVAQTFNLKDYRVLLWPTALLLIPLTTYSAENIMELREYLGLIWPLYATTTAQLFIPFLLLIVAVIKGKPKSQKKKKQN